MKSVCLSLPRGSAWANTVSQYTQAILLFLYVWWKKIHVETWGGTVHIFILQKYQWLVLGIWHCHQQPRCRSVEEERESMHSFYCSSPQVGPGTVSWTGVPSSGWRYPACL